MKIVRIIARLNVGGPARNAVLLSEGLRCEGQGTPYQSLRSGTGQAKDKGQGGYETILVCGEVSNNEGDMTYLARDKGVVPIIVKELGRDLSIINDWKAFWKICKIIRKEKPDIVHTHTAKAGALGRLAGILCGCRLVHTFHGHVFRGYFGRVKSWMFLWVEKILALFTDKIITVSETLKKELVVEYRIAPEGKVQVVELGFDLGELLSLPVKEAGDIVKIGIVGRLVPIKNHKMLFRVASRDKGQGTRDKVRFIVIGDGGLRSDLENYVKELGIKDIVEFKGWVKDLKEIYEDMDILVLTSLNEGTPVSIIEAMASARPVVATDVGGVRDVVEDGKSGYLVKSGDERDFSEKLAGLVSDRDKRLRFGEYGRESVRERFSKERLIKDIYKLYNKALSKGDSLR